MTSKESKFKEDINVLDKLNISYFSCELYIEKNEKGEYIRDEDNRLKKIIESTTITKYKDRKINTYFNKSYNGTAITLGEKYNLIGFDVDNKSNTLKKWEEFLTDEDLTEYVNNTLKVSTMNNGFHYYFKLTKKMRMILEKIRFKSKNDAILGLHIDVKYNNQIFFGPSIIKADKTYRYQIISPNKPQTLPLQLFYELVIENYISESKFPALKKLMKCQDENKYEEICNEIFQMNEEKEKKVITKSKKELKKLNISKESEDDNISNETDISKEDDTSEADVRLKLYLDCLNPQKWDKYEDWFRLGAIICNENGSFDLFVKYSKLSNKFNLKECKSKWKEYDRNREDKLTIATLIKMAKQDNPTLFTLASQKDRNTILFKILNSGITDKSAADLFYFDNKDKCIYSETNESWYVMNEYNIWKKDSKGYEIIKQLANGLPKIITDYYSTLLNKIKNDCLIKIYSDNWRKAIKILETNRTKKSMVEELKYYFKSDTVYERMDNVNDYLFAFDNGVWDLQNNIFRLPLPEELITCTCGYNYSPENDVIIKVEENIMEFFNSIFKKKEDVDYLLFTVSQCLSGVPSREEYYCWLGLGRNGKGVTRDLIKQTFGNYFDVMDIEYLNKTKIGQSATAADEVIARKKNCRLLVSTEPDSAMETKTNKIKAWTGGDPIQCRENYGHSFNYIPKFRLFLQTNFDLYFSGSNSVAMTERLKVIRFPFSFVENPQNKNEKLLDRDLKERIKGEYYNIAFFHILLKYYNKWIENNKKINITENVRRQTALMLTIADPFTPFYNEVIEKVNDTKQYARSSDLFNAFKKYYENGSGTIRMNTTEFKSALESKGNKASTLNGRIIWRGLKINYAKLGKENFDVDFLDD